MSNKKQKDKTRLAPKPSTLREIHILSGNQCARPGCNTVLVNSNGTSVASVCHIYAAEKNGPRPNNSLTPEQKRHSKNLILLCNTCHALVDSEEKTYTAEMLKKWKSDREKIFSEIGDSLQKSYLEQISDERDHFIIKSLINLDKYSQYLDQNNVSHSVGKEEVAELNSYVERLMQLTLSDRSLLTKIVERALATPNIYESERGIDVHPDDLKVLRIDGVPLSQHRIRKFADTLERHRLGYLDFECAQEMRIYCPFDYLCWADLQEFATENGKTLDNYICHLDFSDFEESSATNT